MDYSRKHLKRVPEIFVQKSVFNFILSFHSCRLVNMLYLSIDQQCGFGEVAHCCRYFAPTEQANSWLSLSAAETLPCHVD